MKACRLPEADLTPSSSPWKATSAPALRGRGTASTLFLLRLLSMLQKQGKAPLLVVLVHLKTFLNTQDKWETIKLCFYSTFHAEWILKLFTKLNHTVRELNNVNLIYIFFGFKALLRVLLLLSKLNNSFPPFLVLLFNIYIPLLIRGLSKTGLGGALTKHCTSRFSGADPSEVNFTFTELISKIFISFTEVLRETWSK